MQVDGTYPSKGPMMTFQVYPAFGSVSRRCRRQCTIDTESQGLLKPESQVLRICLGGVAECISCIDHAQSTYSSLEIQVQKMNPVSILTYSLQACPFPGLIYGGFGDFDSLNQPKTFEITSYAIERLNMKFARATLGGSPETGRIGGHWLQGKSRPMKPNRL